VSALKFDELKEILVNSALNKNRKDHMIKTYLELEVYNEDKDLIAKKRYRSRSWVKPFMIILQGIMNNTIPTFPGFYSSLTSTYDISIQDSQVNIGNLFNVLGPEGNSWYGIIAGTGTNPINCDSYTMQSPISEGDLHYYATNVQNVNAIRGGWEFWVTRSLLNKTTNPMTLSEFALIAKYTGSMLIGSTYASSASIYWMLLHDVVSNPPSIPGNSVLVVKYIFDFLA